MCGIAGIVSDKVNRAALKRMVGSLAHRGPDGDGFWFTGSCGLGHRRLSIVDLATGDQPMLANKGKLAVTFNGEIFGYKEIRDKLKYPYRTTSDTEVILALYDRYGEKMMSKLPGQFAFAVWDERKKQLFCARDRFGEKPFYYAIGKNGEFIFASEIRAIVTSGLVKPKLDRESLSHYLQYLYVSPDKTIYENIFVLPPASYLVYKKGKAQIKKYWRLPKINESIGLTEASEKFAYLMDEAVRKQLVADVPVGAFLSGGLDSTTVVALASKHHPDIQTFSFSFDGLRDESSFARDAANKYKTKHIVLKASLKNIDQLILEMSNVYDEPFADSSNIPTYLIAKLAREHVTVALSGDGGDELLGGYSQWYKPLFYGHIQPTFPGDAFLLRVARYLAHQFDADLEKEINYRYLAASLEVDSDKLVGEHYRQMKRFGDDEIESFGLVPQRKPVKGGFDEVMRTDVVDYMPGDILVKTDRASMAHGLELRAPFLDHRLAEFCMSVPGRLKIKNGRDKYLLRSAFEKKWPESVRSRSKQGFGSPVAEWLGNKKVTKLRREYLADKKLKMYTLFDYDALKNYREAGNYQTWIFLNLSIWMEKHKFDY